MVKMSESRLKHAVEASADDVVEACEAVCTSYQELLEVGGFGDELMDIMHDIQLVKTTVKTSGLESYQDLLDPKHQFALTFGCEVLEGSLSEEKIEKLEAKYITAAEEGLKEYWVKIVEWLKNLWQKIVAWFQNVLTLRNFYIKRIRAKIESFSELIEDKEISAMDLKTADKAYKMIKALHESVITPTKANGLFNKIRRAATNAVVRTVNRVVGEVASTWSMFGTGDQKKIEEIFEQCGFVLEEMDNGTITVAVGKNDNVFDKIFEVKSGTVKSLGYDKNKVKDMADKILQIESKDEFRKAAKAAETAIKDYYDNENDRLRQSEMHDDDYKTVVSNIRKKGSAVRILSRAMMLENRLVVRLCKTCLHVLSAQVKSEA